MSNRKPNALGVKGIFTLTVIILTLFTIIDVTSLGKAEAGTQTSAEYQYFFTVNEDGDTDVETIFIHETPSQGSSWLLVPSYTEFRNQTARGVIASYKLQPLTSEGVVNPFWQNYSFTYTPVNGVFNLTLWFRFSHYTQIIEPDGFFLSPQLEYNPSANARLFLVLPQNTEVKGSDVKLLDYLSGSINAPSGLLITRLADRRLRITGLATASSRLAVAFTLPGRKPDLITPPPSIGRFSAYTVKRYEDRAWSILALFNATYPTFTETFRVDIGNMSFEFFVPSMNEFLQGLAGFVPLSGKDTRIFLNPFFYRMMEGYIEIVALHELVHHFLLDAGISPSRLWVHEGMAEYFSTEVAKIVGYATAAMENENALKTIAEGLGGNLGFIQEWTVGATPRDVKKYYAAAYEVFKVLGDRYGGLNYYKSFFSLIKGYMNRTDDAIIVSTLGRAANDVPAVITQFGTWGFTNIIDPLEMESRIEQAQTLISELNPVLQPYKILAQWTLSRAVEAYRNGRYYTALTYINDAVFLAENAFTLTVATFIGVAFIALAVYGFKIKRTARVPGPRLEEARYCLYCGSRLPPEAVYCPTCGLKQK